MPETTTEPAPQSVVFNEISGVDTGSQEQIVSRDQTDIAAIDELTTTTPVSEDEGLVNRKVRTVTVRPDGTIVSGDESLAGAAILPVDRPDVPDVPGANFSTPEMVANVDAAATATVPDIAPATPATPTTPPVTPGSTVQAVDLAGNPLTGRTAPVPFQRPANFATLSANAAAAATAVPATTQTITTDATPLAAPTQQAPAPVETTTTPVAATPTVTTTPTSNAAAYAQLASLRSEADAQAVAQRVTTRFGVLFGSSPWKSAASTWASAASTTASWCRRIRVRRPAISASTSRRPAATACCNSGRRARLDAVAWPRQGWHMSPIRASRA